MSATWYCLKKKQKQKGKPQNRQKICDTHLANIFLKPYNLSSNYAKFKVGKRLELVLPKRRYMTGKTQEKMFSIISY